MLKAAELAESGGPARAAGASPGLQHAPTSMTLEVPTRRSDAGVADAAV